MLSSIIADTKQPATFKKKSVLTTVSPGMKQRVSPGSINNGFGYGFGFDLPDDISNLDGLAKIVHPNITITQLLPFTLTTNSAHHPSPP
jgi:hypothetical protein